jgi:hypothetical protein
MRERVIAEAMRISRLSMEERMADVLRRLKMNSTKERRQAHLSQSFAGAGQLFDISEWEKIDYAIEDLCRETLRAGGVP